MRLQQLYLREMYHLPPFCILNLPLEHPMLRKLADLLEKFGPKLITALPMILQILSLLDAEALNGFSATPESEEAVASLVEKGASESDARKLVGFYQSRDTDLK